MKVKISYFNKNGKWYSDAEYETAEGPGLYEIWEELRGLMQEGRPPDLIEHPGRPCEFIALINVPDHPHGHLHIVGLSGLRFKETAEEIQRDEKDRGFAAKVTEENLSLFSEKLLLIVSEISEAFEEWRDGHSLTEVYYKPGYDPKGLKPEGIPIELADVAIRLLHFCEANEIDLEEAIRLKMAFNKTRPYRHGGKRA